MGGLPDAPQGHQNGSEVAVTEAQESNIEVEPLEQVGLFQCRIIRPEDRVEDDEKSDLEDQHPLEHEEPEISVEGCERRGLFPWC